MLEDVDEAMLHGAGSSGGAGGEWVPWAQRPLEPSVRALILSWTPADLELPPPCDPPAAATRQRRGAPAAAAHPLQPHPLQHMMRRSRGFVEALQRRLRSGATVSVATLGQCWPGGR